MAKLIKDNIFVFALFFLVLVALSCSTPTRKPKDETSTDINQKTNQGRTIMSSASNMMKDMFDWSSVTWVPLGSLIFGKTDESLGFAKWPSKNNNNNGK